MTKILCTTHELHACERAKKEPRTRDHYMRLTDRNGVFAPLIDLFSCLKQSPNFLLEAERRKLTYLFPSRRKQKSCSTRILLSDISRKSPGKRTEGSKGGYDFPLRIHAENLLQRKKNAMHLSKYPISLIEKENSTRGMTPCSPFLFHHAECLVWRGDFLSEDVPRSTAIWEQEQYSTQDGLH